MCAEDKYYTTILLCVSVPPKNLNFRMSIPAEFRDTWSFFNKRAKLEGDTPAELLRDLVEEYLEEYENERSQAEEELDELAPLRDKVPKKVKVKRPVKPKRKSFISKKVSVTKPKEEISEEVIGIQDTPKFKLLELMRLLDTGNGVDPGDLRKAAQSKGISNPRLQLNKMMRRGILYAHEGRIHVT